MGQHQTLPGGQHDPPRTREQTRRSVDGDRDVDQAPAPPAPAPASERPSYRGIPLDGTTEQLHRAVDQLEADTVPSTYYAKVIANQREREEPLGRRTPEPLDSRQGVER